MNKWIIGIILAAVIFMITVTAAGGYLAFYLYQQIVAKVPPPRLPPPTPESDDQKRQDTLEAFNNTEQPDGEETQAIQNLFKELSKAFRSPRQIGVTSLFDVQRMFLEIERLGVLGNLNVIQRTQYLSGFEDGFGSSLLAEKDPTFFWERTDIKKIKLNADHTEALVYSRHWIESLQVAIKKRWWLTHKNGIWRVYDIEDLGSNIRVSTLIAMGLVGGGQTVAPWHAAFRTLMSVDQMFGQADLDNAERSLKSIESVKFPAEIESIRWIFHGILRNAQGKSQEALKDLDRAASFSKDPPLLDEIYAQVYAQLGQHEKAVEHAKIYIDQIGDDPDVNNQLGHDLLALNKRPEAAEAFRKALDDNPALIDALQELRQLLPTGEKTEFGNRFAKIANSKEHFQQLATNALAWNDWEALEILLERHHEHIPADPVSDYYRCRILIEKKQLKEAVPLFKKAIAKISDPESKVSYSYGFTYAMWRADKAIEAYLAVPDSRQAFITLARWFFPWHGSSPTPKDKALLQELLKAHRQKDPDDPWITYYAGLLHLDAKEFDKADDLLGSAWAKCKVKDDKEIIQSARVYSRFKAGKGISAYQEFESKKSVFTQLARLFSAARDATSLEALLAMHIKADAGDDDLLIWEAEVPWLRDDYAKTLSMLRENQSRILAKQQHQWKFLDHLIRSLVRLKRLDEALAELQTHSKDYTDPLYLAIIHASKGDVTKTASVIEKYVKENEGDAGDLYSDPDLGPLLRTAPFKSIREKYPEPKENEKDGNQDIKDPSND